jgi:hypothetical protein
LTIACRTCITRSCAASPYWDSGRAIAPVGGSRARPPTRSGPGRPAWLGLRTFHLQAGRVRGPTAGGCAAGLCGGGGVAVAGSGARLPSAVTVGTAGPGVAISARPDVAGHHDLGSRPCRGSALAVRARCRTSTPDTQTRWRGSGEWAERGLAGVWSRTRTVWSALPWMRMCGSSAAEKCYPNMNSTILSHETREAREDHSGGRFGGQNAASEG